MMDRVWVIVDLWNLDVPRFAVTGVFDSEQARDEWLVWAGRPERYLVIESPVNPTGQELHLEMMSKGADYGRLGQPS